MKPSEIRKIKRRLIASIDKELRGKVTKKGNFGRHAKSPDYRLYGKNNFVKNTAKARKKKTT